MPVNFVVFDAATGQIARTGSCSSGDLEHQTNAGEAVVAIAREGVQDDTHYMDLSDEPIPRERPAMLFRLEVRGNAVQVSAPAGASIMVSGPGRFRQDLQVDAPNGAPGGPGLAVVTCERPGRYRVRVRRFPFRDAEQSVVVPGPAG